MRAAKLATLKGLRKNFGKVLFLLIVGGCSSRLAPDRAPAGREHHGTPSYKESQEDRAPAKIKIEKNDKTPRQINELIRYAKANAHSSSIFKCYRFVKNALLHAGLVDRYLDGDKAILAPPELVKQNYVQRPGAKIPSDAKKGDILVYKGPTVHGHIEIATGDGFVSDFFSDHAVTGDNNESVGRGFRLVAIYCKKGS